MGIFRKSRDPRADAVPAAETLISRSGTRIRRREQGHTPENQGDRNPVHQKPKESESSCWYNHLPRLAQEEIRGDGAEGRIRNGWEDALHVESGIQW